MSINIAYVYFQAITVQINLLSTVSRSRFILLFTFTSSAHEIGIFLWPIPHYTKICPLISFPSVAQRHCFELGNSCRTYLLTFLNNPWFMFMFDLSKWPLALSWYFLDILPTPSCETPMLLSAASFLVSVSTVTIFSRLTARLIQPLFPRKNNKWINQR